VAVVALISACLESNWQMPQQQGPLEGTCHPPRAEVLRENLECFLNTQIFIKDTSVLLAFRFPSLFYDLSGKQTHPTSFGWACSTNCATKPVKALFQSFEIHTIRNYLAT